MPEELRRIKLSDLTREEAEKLTFDFDEKNLEKSLSEALSNFPSLGELIENDKKSFEAIDPNVVDPDLVGLDPVSKFSDSSFNWKTKKEYNRIRKQLVIDGLFSNEGESWGMKDFVIFNTTLEEIAADFYSKLAKLFPVSDDIRDKFYVIAKESLEDAYSRGAWDTDRTGKDMIFKDEVKAIDNAVVELAEKLLLRHGSKMAQFLKDRDQHSS